MAPSDPRAAREALVRFASAYLFLLLGLGTLAVFGAPLAQGRPLEGAVLAGVHFVTLGWLSLSIFAALRVFGGVALGSPLESRIAGRVQWIAWLIGSTSFPVGLGLGSAHLIGCGAAALTVGVAAFTWVAVPAYARATRGRLTRAYLVVALASLWVVLSLGATAGLRRAGLIHVTLPPGYLGAHVFVAVFGWVGATVVGVGTHLIPMFALSRDPSEWPARAALPLFASVPVLGAIGAFFPSPALTIGWIAAAVGSALWVAQVAIFARNRIRRESDAGLGLAAFATALLGIAWVGSLLTDRTIAFVALLVVGWLSLFTLGIYHRVVPFLVWFGRFSGRVGRGRVPMVKDLTDARVARFTAWATGIGALAWTVGIASTQVPVAMAGAAAMFVGASAGLLQIRWLTASPVERAPAIPKVEALT